MWLLKAESPALVEKCRILAQLFDVQPSNKVLEMLPEWFTEAVAKLTVSFDAHCSERGVASVKKRWLDLNGQSSAASLCKRKKGCWCGAMRGS